MVICRIKFENKNIMQSILLKISEIDLKDRLTVEHYICQDIQLIHKLRESIYPLVPLGQIAKVKGGKRLPANAQYSITGIPYVRVVDIGDFEVDLSNVVYISQDLHNKIQRYQLQQNDIAIVIVGATIGKTAIFKSTVSPCNFNENLARITSKDNKFNPQYLLAYLQSCFGQAYISWLTGGSAQAKLSLERIEKINIPILPRPIQDRIAQIMQDAHNTYQNRLKEAEQLEANAKDYVLHTLGVNLSQIEDVKNFIIPSNNLIKQRFDVLYHTFHNLAFFDGFSKEFNLIPLGKIIEDDSYGILTPGDVYSDEHPITYIRVTDMRENMQIKFENSVKVPEEYYRHKRARLKKYDVILAIKGASIASKKSVAFVEDVLSKTIVNGTIFRFQVKKEHNPFYVAVMLDSEIVKGQIRKLQISNNAVAYVDKPSIYALLLPIPPRPLQDHIAQFIQNTYIQSKSLYVEAENLLTEAKVRVERMILGEEEVT